jgi:hypothetical protein
LRLTLYIPGLFGPEARFSREFIPRAPALETILSRADRIEPPPGARHRVLSSLFGLVLPPDADAPVAAVSRFVETAENSAEWWMCADPVHLRADRTGLVLIPARDTGVADQEAQALAADLRDTLAEVGQLEIRRPERWYLKLGRRPELHTRELDQVSGRDIRHGLPGGADAPAWRRLLNEIQIRLHAHEVNRRRESRGAAPVNSLWFWGCGTLPGGMTRTWSRVVGGGSYAEGLARLSGTPFSPEPDRNVEPAEGGDGAVLVVLDDCASALATHDLQAWNRAVGELESAWFEPCLRLLRSRTLGRLEILTERFGFRLAPLSLLKFWRRASLADFVSGAITPVVDEDVGGRR